MSPAPPGAPPGPSFFTTLRALACAATLGGASPAVSREADCAACDLCRDRPDLGMALTERIRAHVAAGHPVEEIARIEGGRSLLVSAVESWANRQPAAVRPDRRRLKYRGASLPDNPNTYTPAIRALVERNGGR